MSDIAEVRMDGHTSGAVDGFKCRSRIRTGPGRRFGLCRCRPKCAVCGYGPHTAINGPKSMTEPVGGEPLGHEYTKGDDHE